MNAYVVIQIQCAEHTCITIAKGGARSAKPVEDDPSIKACETCDTYLSRVSHARAGNGDTFYTFRFTSRVASDIRRAQHAGLKLRTKPLVSRMAFPTAPFIPFATSAINCANCRWRRVEADRKCTGHEIFFGHVSVART